MNKNFKESFAKYGINNICCDFLEKYWDYDMNTVNPNEIGSCSRKIVWIKCQENYEHGSYSILAYSFKQGSRCCYCSGKKVFYKDSLGYRYPEVTNVWSNKNKISPFDVSYGSGLKIWLKCPDSSHSDYLTKPYRAVQCEFRCPNCSREQNKSRLQSKVENFLKSNMQLDILFEYQCQIVPKNPKRIKNSSMPYDIEVLNGLKLLIEVQGEQHYEITGWIRSHAKRNNTTPEYELKMQQVRDRYKKYIAYKNGYNYLAIPYWFEFQDCYKELLCNKIYSILDNPNDINIRGSYKTEEIA